MLVKIESTDVLEEHVTSRFQNVNQAEKTHIMKQAAGRALLVFCLPYSSALKMEGIFFSKTLVDFHQTKFQRVQLSIATAV
jgi:hypothetical protein